MKTFARFQRARAAFGAFGACGAPINVHSFSQPSCETSRSRSRRQNCSYSRARRTRIERGFGARGTHPCSHPGTDALASKPSFDCWRFNASSNRAMDAKSLLSRERQNRARAKPRLFSSLFARLISSATPSAPTLPRSCALGSMQHIYLRPSLASQRVMECGTTMKTSLDSINRASRRRRRLRVRAIGECYFTLRRATSEVVG